MGAARVVSWVVLGSILLVSGGLKSLDAEGTVMATAAYDILPAWMAFLLGAVLPALEVVIGAALLTGWQRRAAATWAVVLGVVFAVANSCALLRGLVVDCQCFGGVAGSSVATSLWIDCGIIAMGLLGLRQPVAGSKP